MQQACVSDTIQGSVVQCVACLCVRYNAIEGGAVCIMSVYQIKCMAGRYSVKHSCVSDTMQGSDMKYAACLCVRYNARH